MPILLLLLVVFALSPILPLVATFYFWYARRKASKAANAANLTGKQVAEQILAAIDRSTQVRDQAVEADHPPSIIPAAHRFGDARRAS